MTFTTFRRERQASKRNLHWTTMHNTSKSKAALVKQSVDEKGKESMRKGGNLKRMRRSWNWISGQRIKGWGAIGAEDSFMAPQAECTLPSLRYSQDGHCWPCRSLCTFEGQQKTREISEKSQVTLQRLYLAAVSVTSRLMKSDIHANLLSR